MHPLDAEAGAIFPPFQIKMLTVVQVLSVCRRCERASRARPRMREIFFCERDNRRIQKDPQASNTHPDAVMRLLLTKKMAGSLRTYCT